MFIDPQVYLTHEVRLTALTSDRIRKVCPPRRLIEELPDKAAAAAGSPPMPPVPQGRVGEAAILQQVADSAGPRTLNRQATLESLPKLRYIQCYSRPNPVSHPTGHGP